MFTWICPQCGREVLPSYDQCPNCAQLAKEAAVAQPPANVAGAPPASQPLPPGYQPPPGYQLTPIPQPPPVPEPPPSYQPPPGYQLTPVPPQPPVYQPPPVAQQPPVYQPPPAYQQPAATRTLPAPSSGLPTWLLTVLFAVVFIGVVVGIYWLIRSPSQAAAPLATVESPAAKPAAKSSAVQKYVEISGVRWTADAKKKIVVKFTVTNHSDADLAGLAGNVTIWGRTQKSEEDPVGTFSFTASVGPQASQEVSAPLNTKLKIYELPDWQNVNADLQITSPQ